MKLVRIALTAGVAMTVSLATPNPAAADEPTLSQILASLSPGDTRAVINSAWLNPSNGWPTGSLKLQAKYAGSTPWDVLNSPAPESTNLNAIFTNGFTDLTATALTSAGEFTTSGLFNSVPYHSSSQSLFTTSSVLRGPDGTDIALALPTPTGVSPGGDTVKSGQSTPYSPVESHNRNSQTPLVMYVLTNDAEDRIVLPWDDLTRGTAGTGGFDSNDLVNDLYQPTKTPGAGLVPQPEPTTMALFGIGLAGLCGRSVRRRWSARKV